MKRLLFHIIVVALVVICSTYAYKRIYSFGFKAGKNYTTMQKTLESWHKNSVDTPPKDPNKRTIRMMSINFGDTTPQELIDVSPIHEIIREKYNIEYVTHNPDILLNGFLGKHKEPKNAKIKLFYTSEVYLENNPQKYLDNYDLVIGFDFIDKTNYFRLPYQYISVHDKIKHDYDRKMKCNPHKQHFACFLVSNSGDWLKGKFDGATARTRMFHKLSLYKKVLSGGKHLNNIGGPTPNTQEFLSQCKFTIAYENTLNYPGYVTEKPFKAWLAGSVPIYSTAPAGLVDLNKKAVIYAGDFQNEDALVDYIIKIDNDDTLYCNIWNQQIIDNPEKDYEAVKQQLRLKLNKIFDQKLGK